MDRRTFLRCLLTAGASSLLGMGVLRAQDARGDPDALIDEAVERLANDPIALQALDLLGTINFADAMAGIALLDDTYVQRFALKLRGLVSQTGEGDHELAHPAGHEHKFPLANLLLAGALNAVRATCFGEEVRHHTVHELETTLIGVGLLMGLTSVARGIVSSEMTAMQMVERGEGAIRRAPEETIADSIFQLTLVAAATQIPLSSFGNAAIGNEKFRGVRLAFRELYQRFLPPEGEMLSREELVAHARARLGESDNPVVNARVERLLADPGAGTREDLARALEAAATAHTHDLMTILMATACDDAQAAAGDPGPLVGLYQTHGLDFIHAIPSIVPYSVLIGVERAMFAAQRAGLRAPVITRERASHMRTFIVETWRNLVVYFATVAPEVSAKIAGTRRVRGTRSKDEDSVGVNFSLLEQVLQDVESIIAAVMDPFLSDRMLDRRKTRAAVADLQEAVRKWHEGVGRKAASRLFRPRESGEPSGEVTLEREEVLELQDQIVGVKAGGKAPYAYDKDAPPRNLKDVQIRLATIVDEAGVNRFAEELRQLRATMGPQLEVELREELHRHGQKPTVMTALKVLQRNPRLRELLDVNYWHDRIGPALTDTMFVVFLQGLHLPFLLSTSELVIYEADWFKRMPLRAREVVSVLYNNAIGIFADNWADCVAHGKWLTNMYLSDLRERLRGLAGEFPEVESAFAAGHFRDDPTRLIPLRFQAHAEQATALIGVVQRRYPADQARLEEALRGHLDEVGELFFKSMLIAMTISVVGAGKSLPGDSTHFTFAAGEQDFTLAVTLKDFQRHPLYHVWELIFSGSYALFVGPMIAQRLVAPGIARLGIGSGVVKKVQSLMQAQFRAEYPGMAERFAELEAQLRAAQDR